MDPTPTLMDAFKGNPIWMSFALMMGGAGFTVALIAVVLVVKKMRGAALGGGIGAAALGALAIAAGLTGMMRGRSMTDEAATTPGLTERDRGRITVQGYGEAGYNLTLGLAAGSLPLLAGLAISVAALRIQKQKR